MNEETRQRLIDFLSDAQKQVDATIQVLSADQWQATVHGHSQWSAADLIRHVAFNESSMNRLIQYIVGGGPGASDDFDVDRYNKRGVEKMQQVDPADLPQRLQAAHEATLQLLADLDDADLAKRGRHGGYGRETTVAGIFEIIGQHKLDHMHEITQAIAD